MKKLINITHTDLDGVGCTAICQYFADKNGYEVEFFNCGYSTVNDRVREVIEEFYLIAIFISKILTNSCTSYTV